MFFVGAILASIFLAGLGRWASTVLCFFFFNLVYIYILVIGNIMNKSLFMQVKIAKTCYYSVKLQQYF